MNKVKTMKNKIYRVIWHTMSKDFKTIEKARKFRDKCSKKWRNVVLQIRNKDE